MLHYKTRYTVVKRILRFAQELASIVTLNVAAPQLSPECRNWCPAWNMIMLEVLKLHQDWHRQEKLVSQVLTVKWLAFCLGQKLVHPIRNRCGPNNAALRYLAGMNFIGSLDCEP